MPAKLSVLTNAVTSFLIFIFVLVAFATIAVISGVLIEGYINAR